MNRCTTRLAVLCTALLLSACATTPVSSPALPGVAYRCEQAEGFHVTFGTDSAVLTGPRGRQVLLRDAGGLTSQQTVYRNAGLRVEFGLGPDGREALLRTVQPAAVLRCVRG